jgi:hypothetical protein
MATPTMTSGAEFLERGPSYMVWLHPALGPLWDVIGQKITGGRLAERAELSLELAEVALENVTVRTSLTRVKHTRCRWTQHCPACARVCM